MGLGGRGLWAEFGGPGPRAPRPSWASGAGGGAMQADPTPERSSRVLTPDPEPGPGSESILDPEQDARAALAEFATLHGPALRASGVPERYWGRLLHKLEHEVRVGAPRGEARGAERARGAPGTKACPRRGRTPAPASQRASFWPSHPGMLCLSDQRALSRPTGPKPGEEAMGCLSATPCSWPCHFIHFQTPTAFCLAVPAGPVPHNTSRLCLKARINKRKQSARLRAWSCGNARRVCECLRRRPPPGQVRPRSLLLLPPGSPGRTHAPPVGQGTALSGVLGPVFLPEVAGRVWSENQPGCAGSPCPVRLCGQGWGDRRASSVEACSLNSPRARLPFC